MRILLHTSEKVCTNEGLYEGHSVSHGTYFLGLKMWRHATEYIQLNARGMLPLDGRICR